MWQKKKGRWGFADVIKNFEMGKLSWIIQVGVNATTSAFI